MFDLATVLVDAKKTLEEDSATDIRFTHNYEIFKRFVYVAESCSTDEEFHRRILTDFELFCVAYVRLDNRKPMYPAPWQSEASAIFETREVNLFIEPRKMRSQELF